MAKQFARLEDDHRTFIEAQHIFFIGSAAPDGRVNISPKGMDSLRVLTPNRILWINLTGSGNETAGHLLEHRRMTLMWCSFTKRPLILRAYGSAHVVHKDDQEWEALAPHIPDHHGARQVFDVTINLVQTSCGYAVPFMEHVAERDTLERWADDKSETELRAYWTNKNSLTIDGAPTRT